MVRGGVLLRRGIGGQIPWEVSKHNRSPNRLHTRAELENFAYRAIADLQLCILNTSVPAMLVVVVIPQKRYFWRKTFGGWY